MLEKKFEEELDKILTFIEAYRRNEFITIKFEELNDQIESFVQLIKTIQGRFDSAQMN